MIKNNLTFELCASFLLLSTYWWAKPSFRSCVVVLVGPHNPGLFEGFHNLLVGGQGLGYVKLYESQIEHFLSGLHTLEFYSCLNVMSKEKRSGVNEVLGDSILLTEEVIPCSFLEDCRWLLKKYPHIKK